MYRGRFAPTISGPLHFGSLITAVASYLDAKANAGVWLLQIDDLDAPRVPPQAESQILTTLEVHGLIADEEPLRQTLQLDRYLKARDLLETLDLLFYCTCTRKQRPTSGPYPGTCSSVISPPDEPHAIRVRTKAQAITFFDAVQGYVHRSLDEIGGDFVIYRKEGIASYPLSAVVDDHTAGVTHVVRGADLLENTVNQAYLIEKLGFQRPKYAHIPVLNERDGIKLSKRNDAVRVDDSQPRFNLRSCLQLLGMEPPQRYSVNDLLTWGVEHWDLEAVPKQSALSEFVSI